MEGMRSEEYDHKNTELTPPKIEVLVYDQKGNKQELCFILPCTAQPENNRQRLDSGYDSEEPLLSHGKLPKRKYEDPVDEAEGQPIEETNVPTEFNERQANTSRSHPAQTYTIPEEDLEAMQPKVKYGKVFW